KWCMTIEENLKNLFPDSSVVAIPAIEELGSYTERQSPVIAITSKCENPGGVFKYLFETMVDGGEGQTLFSYGVEGTHWEKQDAGLVQLMDPETKDTTFTTVFIDPVLCISDWTDKDPLASRDERISTSNDVFLQKSKLAPVIVSNDTMSNYAATLKDIRTVIVSEVVTGDMTVEEGMASYQEQTGSMVEEILASLNN
ncbi:MAG: ABC transporter substrate-binding protein, partial [Cellulosilyticum sp.]|nr:ABC transporter substrate-binding protein [Cellulosilyticum sp.]